jgi:hypothetical protein
VGNRSSFHVPRSSFSEGGALRGLFRVTGSGLVKGGRCGDCSTFKVQSSKLDWGVR